MDKMTTVSTTYARITIMLLALNFVFTGYAITKLVTLAEKQPQTQQAAPLQAAPPQGAEVEDTE